MHRGTQALGMVALALLSSCIGGRRLTDTDPNPLEADDQGSTINVESTELCPAEGFAAECGDADSSSLLATSTQPGRIDVEHRGVAIGCGTWSADARVDGDLVTIEYLSAEDTTADCACAWTFTYWLPVERSGTFTIDAEGDTAVVTVQ